ncbi:hypothetical protein F9K33_13430 [bacterium]|nr:MAG: hypothetical protein F9K33_13430 [bacterium]
MNVYVLGGGTLARLIIDIIESLDEFKIAGFFDDGYPNSKDVLGYSILGQITDIDVKKTTNLVIGIGDPKYRKLIFEEKSAQGFHFPSLVHKSVIRSKYCTIENGVIIGPNSSVLSGSIIKQGSCVLSHVNINQDVVINPFCLIGAGSVIGNSAVLGEGCHIGLANHVNLNQLIDPWTYYNVHE